MEKLGRHLLVSVIFVYALCHFFEPYWETNDDVAMSMVAHGYGIAAFGAPNLVFSNVIWGYLVRVIPTVDGVLGYSIATIIVLVIVGTVIIRVLWLSGYNWLIYSPVLILLLARPVLFPQFTLNSGLLAVGAVVCWYIYGRRGNNLALLAGCLLAFFSYLIRSQMFLLVLFIALPILPWRKLTRDRAALVAALTLLLVIGVAAFFDYQAYQGEDWQEFKALNVVRAPYTDFGAGALIQFRSDILARYGYSANDINLISHFFFEDPKIANPEYLGAMLLEVSMYLISPKAGWNSIRSLFSPVLQPVLYSSLLLLLVLPSRRLLGMWVLALIAIFVMGALGRGGILRVYFPIICLLLIAPLLIKGGRLAKMLSGHSAQLFLLTPILMTAAFLNSSLIFSESRATQEWSRIVQNNFQSHNCFTDEGKSVVLWGAALPYEVLYPVLEQPNFAMSCKFYSLGVFSLAPFSVSYFERRSGNGMLNRLTSKNGVLVLYQGPLHRNLIAEYCKEHLNAILYEEQQGWVAKWRCNAKNSG